MKEGKNYVPLGHCGKLHGIKGGFTFKLYNEEESVLVNYPSVLLIPFNSQSSLSPQGEIFQLKKITFGHKVIAYLEGVDSIAAASELIPFSIHINSQDLPKACEEKGEYYIQDLLGFDVFNNASGEKLGVLKDFYSNGMQTIFQIQLLDGSFLELPFVEDFFPEVNSQLQRVSICYPEYL